MGPALPRSSVIYEAVPGDSICLERPASRNCMRGLVCRPVSALSATSPRWSDIKITPTLLRAAERGDRAAAGGGVCDRRRRRARESLLELRRNWDWRRTVHFTGFVPQAQRLLPGFDAFAMSSCMEGLGTIVLDAALAGVPVAATAGGGLPELVLDQQTGLLAPVGDAAALAEALCGCSLSPPSGQRLARRRGGGWNRSSPSPPWPDVMWRFTRRCWPAAAPEAWPAQSPSRFSTQFAPYRGRYR